MAERVRQSWTASTLCLPAEAPGALKSVIEALRRGELVAFPTDTVYGMAAHAFLPQAVCRLYAAKERPLSMAIPLLLPEAEALPTVCADVPPVAWELARQFWPGALSLVLRRSPAVPDVVTAGGATVAVRVPGHHLARDLARGLGAPLATTSANVHGQPDSRTAEAAWSALSGRISLVLDGGPCPGGLASTVLDLTVWPPAILRPGPVTSEQLARIVPLRH